MASQLREILFFHPNLKILAVQPRGFNLASNLCQRVSKNLDRIIVPGKIDPTFYRDDIGSHGGILFPTESDIKFEIEEQPVLLIDDVIFTGRTIRAAIDAVLDLGRPKWIKLMVFVNRSLEREVPIAVDFEGMRIDLDPNEKIKILFNGPFPEAIISKEGDSNV